MCAYASAKIVSECVKCVEPNKKIIYYTLYIQSKNGISFNK